MAISPKEQFVGQVITDDAGYPEGRPRNAAYSGDPTATPADAAWVSDVWGFQQALLVGADLPVSGSPDSVAESQYLQALMMISGARTSREPVFGFQWDGSDESSALQALLDAAAGGVAVLLGGALASLTVGSKVQMWAGTRLVMAPGVRLVGHPDLTVALIDAFSDCVIEGGEIDTQLASATSGTDVRAVLSVSDSVQVERLRHPASTVYLTGDDCIARHTAGGKLVVTGDRARIDQCETAVTFMLEGNDCVVHGGAFSSSDEAMQISGERATVVGATFRSVSGDALTVSNFGGSPARARFCGCTFASDSGRGLYANASDIELLGCRMVGDPALRVSSGKSDVVALSCVLARTGATLIDDASSGGLRMRACDAGDDLLPRNIFLTGKVSIDGSISSGVGFTANRTSPGAYTITFASPRALADYAVGAHRIEDAGRTFVNGVSPTGFTVLLTDDAGTPESDSFSFWVINA